MPRPIAFLTDLGTCDDAVGICKGLMMRSSPASPVIDITHAVEPFNVEEAARYLADAPRYFPADTVFAVIVIPETGTSAIDHVVVGNRTGQLFVAPDNGVLTLAVPPEDVAFVRRLDARVHEGDASPTFDGRDVIAFGAGLLASGTPPDALGPPRGGLRRLSVAEPHVDGDGAIAGHVVLIDKNFGNVWTNIAASLCRTRGLEPGACHLHASLGGTERAWPLVRTFGDVPVGQELAYVNSRGYLSFGVNQGSLVARLAVGCGDEVRVLEPVRQLAGSSP